jgi:hypothetical protein
MALKPVLYINLKNMIDEKRITLMDLNKAKEKWINIPPAQRAELHEAYKAKVKQILEIYTEDLSFWLDQVEAKETIPEFIDRWVEYSLRKE